MPRLISLYNLKFKFKNYDDVLRKQIILNEKKRNILENFIRNSLPLVLPISIVESFKDLLKMTNFNLFPKKPKIIFTAYKYDYDDFFKIYTAEKIQNNCKFFIYQHGNNYFTSIDGKHFPELKIANLFLTWGIKEKKNQYPFFNIAIHNRASFEKKFNKKGGLTIISHTGSHRVKIWDKFDDGLISAKSTLKILKQLDKKILKNTILKLFPGNNFLDQMIYKKFYKNLNIARIENKKSFFELHKETKLFLFNYDSTGLLQNLLLNIPSVAYWDYTFNNINTKYIKYYNLLIDAKILFTKKEQLIEHINKNWGNIDKWWFKKDVQDKILKFNLKINNYADKKKLLKLIAHLKK